ncbi:MAG TPA: hypothetical protein VLJ19_05885 [Variovorax sp.]|nr:hypothetical protein [Variovorax sp.]
MPASPHLLIPYAGRGTPACRAALASLKLRNLERLMARLELGADDTQDDTTLSPPHERALAAALGIAAPDGCIPWAAWQAREADLPQALPGQAWSLMTLCHWQVGIDDAALGDPQALGIGAEESAILFEAVRPFLAEDGIELHPTPQPGRWLAQGRLFDGLASASIDRAVGHPISDWSPLTEATRPLRRLQNEIQMLLYTHPVNDARAERGLPAINSFWASGTGALPANAAPAAAAPEVDQRLRDAAVRDDSAAWAQAWQALDAQRLPALLAEAERGAAIRLTLCGDRSARSFTPRPGGFTAFAKRLFERAPASAELLGTL